MQGSSVIEDLSARMLFFRQKELTGLVSVSAKEKNWRLYFVLGRVVWVKSRVHALRRWERQLLVHNPTFHKQIIWPASSSYKSWDYNALVDLVKMRSFSQAQFSRMAEGLVTEDLFDILQVGTLQHRRSGRMLAYKVTEQRINSSPNTVTYQDGAWQNAQDIWKKWEKADLDEVSPDWAPMVTNVELLKSRTSPQTFQTLTKYMDGRQTLRDLAIKLSRPLVSLTKAVMPYISRQMLSFTELPDLVDNFDHHFYPNLFVSHTMTFWPSERSTFNTPPFKPPLATRASEGVSPVVSPPVTSSRTSNRSSAPKIIYIDDSPADSRAMSAVVEKMGYQYSNISDPIHALPMLLEIKPKLIFLDLVMPIANGYEVCAQIRRISAFKNTPVVIVTSNDGIGDRVRARFVGASGFLGKPIRPEKVRKVLNKFLGSFEMEQVSQQTDVQASSSGSEAQAVGQPVISRSRGVYSSS